MTFDDDYIQLSLATGRLRRTCKQLGLSWPPPEVIEITGMPYTTERFRRIRFSQITDEERAKMTHVCRGAEYIHDTQH